MLDHLDHMQLKVAYKALRQEISDMQDQERLFMNGAVFGLGLLEEIVAMKERRNNADPQDGAVEDPELLPPSILVEESHWNYELMIN
jgi:hypothetical protein